jgi:hypothetical protein
VTAGGAQGQVLSPAEITDPALRALQEKYDPELKAISAAIRTHQFPFHFYMSRKLDLTESQQQSTDQRAIRFDKYQGQVVLEFTGNYFASYSAVLMTDSERARATYLNVMLPILLEAIPRFSKADMPQAFALEISHHVRKRILGVANEQPENVVLVLQKDSAERLLAAKDDAGRHSAVLEGEAFLNAEPVQLWPEDEKLLAVRREPVSISSTSASAPISRSDVKPNSTVSAGILEGPSLRLTSRTLPPQSPSPLPQSTEPVQSPVISVRTPEAAQDISPASLKDRDTAYHGAIETMLKELEAQAHFVAYAPPSFMTFHNAAYLQISVTTPLNEESGSSLYRLAALAFDRHIAHLIRPIVAYFKDSADFSGIDFSTSIRAGGKAEDGSAEAVEYIFSLRDLRSYENFDLTGQELIRSGFVIVNGERISLELQEAEGKK